MKTVAAAVFAFLPVLAFATQYHVDSRGGNDANDGLSAETAFRSLERATKCLKAGDVLSLAPGSVFGESLVFKSSGTAEKPIVVRGNGAIVSGLHSIDVGKWESKGSDLWFQASDRCWGALRPRVFVGDAMISVVANPKELKPKTAVWRKEGIYFRAESGKSPRDYALLGGIGRSKSEHSGVIIDGKSYITVENLVAQHFPNDGFNVHGTCRGLVFQNIVARHNGDDGFSIHDDVCATVVGLHSHHNDFGIQDVGFSQTIVSGAILEQNRLCGFDEHGGMRILRDSVVRANGRRQIALHRSQGGGKATASPMESASAYLENVKVEGDGDEGLFVEDGVTLTAKKCSFSGSKVGLALTGGRVHMTECSVANCNMPTRIDPACSFSHERCTGVAEGWDNVNPERGEVEPARLYWEAPLAKGAAAFSVEKREGAEGDVTFADGAMTVRKTNEKGWIVVKSKDSFSVKADTTLRSFADAEVRGSDPFHSVAVPRIFGKKETLGADWQLDAVSVFMRGGPKMGNLANTAPGQTERRFASVKVTDDFGTKLVPALVVAGAPSTSVWKRWGVEDHDRAEALWKSRCTRHRGVEGRFSQGIPASEYLKRLESDFDHTAKVEKGDGETRLVVDGRIEPPVLYKPNHGWSQNWYRTTGGFLSREGVNLQTVLMDARNCWGPCGFASGVKKAIDCAVDQMRRAPDALFFVSFRLYVPPEYTAVHPDDVWRNPDGTPVYGNYDKIKNWQDGKPPKGCWPWPSMSSPVWRRDIKSFLEAAIFELKKNGLAKRIVGFHLCGYHDGQFAPYKPDYSTHGIRAFREWCAEHGKAVPDDMPMPVCTANDDFFPDTPEGRLKRDFQTFHHLASYYAQEDFARCAKAAFGKDVVALHWSMDVLESTASGSFYLGEFMKSDVMDGLVSQSCYVQRLPSLALGEPFPTASFARHGKLYVDELDLRTYGLIAGGIGEPSAYGLGHSRDFAEWQSVHHRIAGIGMARRQGWWYYEISGGFFEPPEIAADIGDVTRLRGEMARQKRRSGWKPSAAFLVDEKGLLARNHICGIGTQGGDRRLVVVQVDRLAASGVPHDVWLADDAFEDESVVADRKVVVIAGFFDLTEKKAAFVRRLLSEGKTVVLLAGTGAAGGAERLGLRPTFRPSPVSHEVESLTGDGADFRSSFHVEWLRWTLGEKSSPLDVWWRPSCFSFEKSVGFTPLARYAVDGAVAAVESRTHGGRLVALGEAGGLTPAFFNRLMREAGGYVPVDCGGKLQVDMNGDFISIHALDNGHFDFRLPFPCKVVNLKTGKPVATSDGMLPLDLTAGETRWYSLKSAKENDK